MFILMEMSDARGLRTSGNYDFMGYTISESDAMKWVSNNPEYRTYKYCPDKEIKLWSL